MDKASFQRTALTTELAQLQRRTLTTELAELERRPLTTELAELDSTALHTELEQPEQLALKKAASSLQLTTAHFARERSLATLVETSQETACLQGGVLSSTSLHQLDHVLVAQAFLPELHRKEASPLSIADFDFFDLI